MGNLFFYTYRYARMCMTYRLHLALLNIHMSRDGNLGLDWELVPEGDRLIPHLLRHWASVALLLGWSMWNLPTLHWPNNWCCYYTGLIQATTWLRVHGYSFPVRYRKTLSLSRHPGLLKPAIFLAPLPWFSLRFRCSGSISDVMSWGCVPHSLKMQV